MSSQVIEVGLADGDISLNSDSTPTTNTNSTNLNLNDYDVFDTRNRDPELDGNDLEPIAICGFSIKFPQEATSPEAFWKLICEKRCAMTDFPESRLNKDGFYRETKRRNTVRHALFGPQS